MLPHHHRCYHLDKQTILSDLKNLTINTCNVIPYLKKTNDQLAYLFPKIDNTVIGCLYSTNHTLCYKLLRVLASFIKILTLCLLRMVAR